MRFINTFNRVVIVILCLALIVFLTALFLIPETVLLGLGNWMIGWGEYLGTQDPLTRTTIGAVLAAIAAVLLLIIIYLEVRRSRKRYLRVQQVSGGMANISTESVTELLQHRLDPEPGVIHVEPYVRAKGNRVSALVDVGVTPDTNVPQIANRLIKITQETLTDEMGLRIAGQPEVRVTVVSDKEAVATGRRAVPTESEVLVAREPAPPVVEGPPEMPPLLREDIEVVKEEDVDDETEDLT